MPDKLEWGRSVSFVPDGKPFVPRSVKGARSVTTEYQLELSIVMQKSLQIGTHIRISGQPCLVVKNWISIYGSEIFRDGGVNANLTKVAIALFLVHEKKLPVPFQCIAQLCGTSFEQTSDSGGGFFHRDRDVLDRHRLRVSHENSSTLRFR